jgi:2,3-bisphosphoglycerate-independent phosphoglycerate mutase
MKVILIFVDGLGIGDPNSKTNPCIQKDLNHLCIFRTGEGSVHVPGNGGQVIGLDASMGVPGLPQSATGQTALLSGLNAAGILGRHLQGFPNKVLCELLKDKALPLQILNLGRRPVFINAYRPEFFTLPESIKWRLSVTTVANLAAGLPFRTYEDLKDQKALFHDFTNIPLIRKGVDVPEYTPEQAGEILVRISMDYDFTLYEYFLTDKVGHSQELSLARTEIRKLDRFLSSILNNADLEHSTIILTSDHGNIEDLSVKTHSLNPAMTIVWGAHSGECLSLKTLQELAPFIISCLKEYP